MRHGVIGGLDPEQAERQQDRQREGELGQGEAAGAAAQRSREAGQAGDHVHLSTVAVLRPAKGWLRSAVLAVSVSVSLQPRKRPTGTICG